MLLTDFPPETLELIAKKVPRRDHQEMRMVSRQLYLVSYCWCIAGAKINYAANHKCVLKVDPCNEITPGKIGNKWVVAKAWPRSNDMCSLACIMDWVIRYNHLESLKVMLEDDRNIVGEMQSILWDTSTEICEILLNDGRYTPTDRDIVWVAQRGHTETVQLMIADGRVNVAAHDNAPIRYAAAAGHINVVRLLMDTGLVDPAAQENVIIHAAAINGRTDVVKLLLTDPRVRDNLAIMKATYIGGYEEIIDLC